MLYAVVHHSSCGLIALLPKVELLASPSSCKITTCWKPWSEETLAGVRLASLSTD